MQLEREIFNQPVFSMQFQTVGSAEDFIFSGLTGCFVTAKIKTIGSLSNSYHANWGYIAYQLECTNKKEDILKYAKVITNFGQKSFF